MQQRITGDSSDSRSFRTDTKGDIVGAKIRELDATGIYDFFFPTDCDEFVIKQTAAGFTCDRTAIHAYLETLQDEPQTLRMRYQIANHPLLPDFYVHFASSKTFFAKSAFGWTDHGHHCDGSRLAEGSRYTAILQAHFHYIPFERLVQSVRHRWIGTIDIDDREKLATYTGDSYHLARYLLMDREDYYAQFQQKMLIHFPQLQNLLRRLGTSLRIPMGDQTPDEPDDGDTNWTAFYAPSYVQEQAYLQANPDVAAAGMNATEHYLTFGFREGRHLAPPETAAPTPPRRNKTSLRPKTRKKPRNARA